MRSILQKIIRFGVSNSVTETWTYKLTTNVLRHYRFRSNDVIIQTTYDDDIQIEVNLRDLLGAQIYFQGVDRKDRGEVRLLKRLLKPNDVVFDVGANIGVITMLAAKHVPYGTVHSFEPSSENVARLQRNLSLNQFNNVIVNQTAVSSKVGELELFIPDGQNIGALSLYPDKNWNDADKEVVPAITLDNYVQEHEIRQVNYIKMDIEGAEMDALAGARKILEEHRPIVLMEITKSILKRAGHTVSEVWDWWQGLEYDLYDIQHNGSYQPIYNVNDFKDDHNILCLPR